MSQIMNKMPDASRVKDAHAEQEAKVKSSLQKIKNKFIVMSGKGGVGKTSVSVNKALETIIGYSRDELIGQPCSILNCDICEIARAEKGNY